MVGFGGNAIVLNGLSLGDIIKSIPLAIVDGLKGFFSPYQGPSFSYVKVNPDLPEFRDATFAETPETIMKLYNGLWDFGAKEFIKIGNEYYQYKQLN